MKRLSAFILLFAFAFSAYGQTGEERDAAGNGIRSDFLIELAKGDVRDHIVIHKFGAANDIGTAWTLVSSSKTYQTPATAQALEAVSTSDSDSTGNAGLQSVCVDGLGSGWQLLTECVSLRGTQEVNFDSTFFRVFRLYGNSTGTYANTAASSQVGTITIETQGGSDVWGTLAVEASFGFGQSLIGAYTVPRGYKGYVMHYHVDSESTKIPSIALFRRCNADDLSAPYAGVMRLFNLHRGILGPLEVHFESPSNGVIGPCDIGFFARVPSNTADISVQFELLLVKE